MAVGGVEMLIRVTLGVVAGIACSSCVTPPPNAFEIESRVSSQVEGADCAKLRENMETALEAHKKARDTAKASQAAQVGGMVLSVVPGAGLIAPVVMGASGVGVEKGVYGTIEPEILYRTSHRAYEEKKCKPKITFGE